MKASAIARATLIASTLGALSLTMPATAGQGEKSKLPPVLATLWTAPKDVNTITLIVSGVAEPVTVGVTGETGVGGVCAHCTLNQPFKIKDCKGTCGVCGCSKTNVQCIAWKDIKPSSWEQMLVNLPAGIALRVAYNTPDKPESGLKTVWVDRRTFFAPVEGMDGKTLADMALLAKTVGGGKAEMVDSGKRLLITLKQDYDNDVQAKLEKAMAKIGAKLLHPAEVVASK